MKYCVLRGSCSVILILNIIFYGSVSFAKDKKEKDTSVMELESYIVGDKEQPAVSYFVPWKGSKAPDNLQWNVEEKNDNTLEPIDREVMVRSLEIYNKMDLEGAPK